PGRRRREPHRGRHDGPRHVARVPGHAQDGAARTAGTAGPTRGLKLRKNTNAQQRAGSDPGPSCYPAIRLSGARELAPTLGSRKPAALTAAPPTISPAQTIAARW